MSGHLATDIGGTFTDLVYFDEDTGKLQIAKSLTTPSELTQGLVNALAQSGVTAEQVSFFVHGGTTVINAITERKGVRTALVTTAGFRDILEIARGNRPDLYNLRFRKETPFVPRRLRFEVRERAAADGTVIEPIHLEDLDAVAEGCRREQVEAIAILFLHSYTAPAHEVACAERLAALLPDTTITASHEITREWREYERCNTAVLNAYVQPIVRTYLERLERRLDELRFDCPLFAMQSNGGTTSFEWAKRHPITLVESGPAAGVNGAVLVSRLCEEPNVIYLDIGGTTAKCSTIHDHEAAITTDYRLERSRTNFGYPIRTPVVDIVEIGAGGGSIAWFDAAGRLQVGPVSAGGDPGPACYGLGGTRPTVTDAKLVTGVLNADNFAVGQFRLDADKAREALRPIADGLNSTIDEAAVAIIRLVDASMINALKLVSIQRGHDPREFSMVVGGGGGAMHAATLARELGVKQVIVPTYPGIFSAFGMLASDQRRDFIRSRLTLASGITIEEIGEVFAELSAEASVYFGSGGNILKADIAVSHSCDLRYFGQEHSVTVSVDPNGSTLEEILADFHEAHERTYTFRLPDAEVEFVTFRLMSAARGPRPEIRKLPTGRPGSRSTPRTLRRVNFGEDGVHQTAVFSRADLTAGFVAPGPIVVEEPTSTTIVLPGQELTIDRHGFLRITEQDGRPAG